MTLFRADGSYGRSGDVQGIKLFEPPIGHLLVEQAMNEAVMAIPLPHSFSWLCYATTAWSDFGLDQFWNTVMSNNPVVAFVNLGFALHGPEAIGHSMTQSYALTFAKS